MFDGLLQPIRVLPLLTSVSMVIVGQMLTITYLALHLYLLRMLTRHCRSSMRFCMLVPSGTAALPQLHICILHGALPKRHLSAIDAVGKSHMRLYRFEVNV